MCLAAVDHLKLFCELVKRPANPVLSSCHAQLTVPAGLTHFPHHQWAWQHYRVAVKLVLALTSSHSAVMHAQFAKRTSRLLLMQTWRKCAEQTQLEALQVCQAQFLQACMRTSLLVPLAKCGWMTAECVDVSADTNLTAALVLLPGPLVMREACKTRQLEL